VFGSTVSVPAELVALQYRAFRADREKKYPRLVTEIIVAGRGPAGYISCDEHEPGVLFIVDIALLPEYRGKSIGKAVLAEKLRHCTKATLHVDTLNPAQRLYQRLGFRVVGEDGPFLRMEYTRP
jgi:ribosomal protein S18 acetylase RimI-like enzyme